MYKKEVYFTIITSKFVGFADKLNQSNALHAFGKSIGLEYVHIDFESSRSSNLPQNLKPKLFPRIRRKLKKLLKIIQHLIQSEKEDVFDLTGVNQYYQELSPVIDIECFEIIYISLGTKILAEKKIKNTFDLEKHIKEISDTYQSNKQILALSVFSGRDYIKMIYCGLTFNSYKPGLIEKYFELKQKHGYSSDFDGNKLKILVHVRRGDAGVIKTPWNTYISILKNFRGCFKEYQNFDEYKCKYDRLMHVHRSEYKDFINCLKHRLPNDSCSILVFSDGFKRTFEKIFRGFRRKKKGLNFTKKQLHLLYKSEKNYDKKYFDDLKKIGGLKLIIGEEKNKFKSLVHAIFDANIIVTGTLSSMIPIIISNYFDPSNLPVVVVLYRKKIPDFSGINIKNLSEKFIYINVDNPDFNKAFTEIDSALQKNKVVLPQKLN